MISLYSAHDKKAIENDKKKFKKLKKGVDIFGEEDYNLYYNKQQRL